MCPLKTIVQHMSNDECSATEKPNLAPKLAQSVHSGPIRRVSN